MAIKKFSVLAVLFILPIVAYLFFASGVNNFAKLPTLTQDVEELNSFTSLNGEKVQLQDHITVLSFYGSNIEEMEGNAFNLNEKVYDKNHEFNDFQFVVLSEEGTQEQAKELLKEISTTIDVEKWKFLFGSAEEIENVFKSLKTNLELSANYNTPYVFIIDKKRNLRGREADGDDPVVYGYNTSSVAEITNLMTDDVKVILAEYRLALKKYNKKEGLQ